MRGGKRPGAGRPKCSKMTKTAALVGKLAEDGVTPLEFIMTVMRDEAQPLPIRLNCAMAAAPYIHPRLAHVQVERKPNLDILEKLLRQARDDGKLTITQKPVAAISAPSNQQ